MRLVITILLIAIVYFIGYAMGRKDIVDDIKQMTKELEDKNNDKTN